MSEMDNEILSPVEVSNRLKFVGLTDDQAEEIAAIVYQPLLNLIVGAFQSRDKIEIKGFVINKEESE